MDNAIIIILYTFVFVRGSMNRCKDEGYLFGAATHNSEILKKLNFLFTYNLSRYIMLNIVTYKTSRKYEGKYEEFI